MALNPIIKKKWLNALRSGMFTQTKGSLQNSESNCCLGVLCHITGNASNRDMDRLSYPKENEDCDPKPFCGLSVKVLGKLAEINDAGEDFSGPICYISRNL